MDSKKLRVMKALGEHLTGINPANTDPATDEPYTVDLSASVFRGKLRFGDETARPFLSIMEAPKPLDNKPVGDGVVRKSRWVLLVQGFAADDRENPTDPAYDLLALVEARLARLISVLANTGDPAYPEEYDLGGLVMDIVIGEGIVRPSDPEVSPTAFFYLPVTVELTTNVLNPYAD